VLVTTSDNKPVQKITFAPDGKMSYTNRPVSGEIVQSMFYKAQHQETGNMWDVWLYHHKGTYFLYYLANVGKHRWHACLSFHPG
jgi:hypothetical protein